MIINNNVEVYLLCENCDKPLYQTSDELINKLLIIHVDMCKHCTSDVRNRGKIQGLIKGTRIANEDIDTKIAEGLKDFDFNELFKNSNQYKEVKNLLDIVAKLPDLEEVEDLFGSIHRILR